MIVSNDWNSVLEISPLVRLSSSCLTTASSHAVFFDETAVCKPSSNLRFEGAIWVLPQPASSSSRAAKNCCNLIRFILVVLSAHQSPTDSPPARVAKAAQTIPLIVLAAKRMLPSPRSTLHPLGWSQNISST